MTRWILMIALLPILSLAADNIDLATVPDRQSVELTIYNSEDLTLVRETRTVTFRQGLNPLQFAWSGTLIDPTSVLLRFPDRDNTLNVRDTTYPHDRQDVLYWNVHSDADQEARIEISYFTSGIRWSADYTVIADADETRLDLESFVRVHNHSGEDYRDARVRLVVGSINLVEKIAELARLPVSGLDRMEKGRFNELRQQAARMILSDEAVAMAPAPVAEASSRPKDVQKEGLGEYFIYTIEGTETVPDGWSKRLRSFSADDVPLEVVYRYRPRQYGDRLVRLYLLDNDNESGLGSTPLPDGQVRLFRRSGEGLKYLARQSLQYVPIGDRIEFNLGVDPAVVFELEKARVWRDDIWLRLQRGNIYQRADDPGLRVDIDSAVAGWTEHTHYIQHIRNNTDQPIRIEVRRMLPGDISFRSLLNPQLHDVQTVEYHRRIAAGTAAELDYEVIQRQGYNAKQQQVNLESAAARTPD